MDYEDENTPAALKSLIKEKMVLIQEKKRKPKNDAQFRRIQLEKEKQVRQNFILQNALSNIYHMKVKQRQRPSEQDNYVDPARNIAVGLGAGDLSSAMTYAGMGRSVLQTFRDDRALEVDALHREARHHRTAGRLEQACCATSRAIKADMLPSRVH